MLLSINDLKKSFVDNLIFENVNLIVEQRDKIGLIGVNGCGKSTLFNILTGELSKDSGSIFMPKNIKIGYLKQQLHETSTNSIYDECKEVFLEIIKMEEKLRELEKNLNSDEKLEIYGKLQEKFVELDGYSYNSKIRGTLIGLGFSTEDFNKKVVELSGGQKSRLALAKLLLDKPDLLLLDEPTNHLDIESVQWLEKYLKDFSGSIILISHDRYFLDNVTNKISLLENKTLTTYVGNYTSFMKKRKKDLEILTRQYENQQREIKRQEEIVQRFLSKTSNEKALKQGKSRQKLLDKIKRLPPPPTEAKKADIRFKPKYDSGKEVLKVKDISKSFGDKNIFENVNFNIYKSEKVGLIGPNGVGKTTLFKIIVGILSKDSGEIEYGTKVNISYFSQEMEDLNRENTIIDEIWDFFPKLTHFEIRSYLAKFMFIGDDVFKLIDDLSGGEKARVSLLKIMLKGSNFLLLDEPTNHLDIVSKEGLEQALKVYDGTVLSISHDRYFLNSVCDKILNMTKDGVYEYLGNYDYFIEKTTKPLKTEEVYISKTEIANQKKEERKKQLEKKKIQEERKKLEEEINNLELRLKIIDEELSNPKIYEDINKVNEVSNERDDITIKLEELYEKWFDE